MPRHIPQRTSLELEPHQILLRPMVTEKGTDDSTKHNAYTFQVNKLSTKHDVRRAIEKLFDVKVTKVHIQNRKGKPRRTRQFFGYTNDWKKAIVTLDKEYNIEFF
jgi:large subunit ribosomal protein L23